MKSSGLKETGLSKDGRSALLTFKMEDGAEQQIEVDSLKLAAILQELTALVNLSRQRSSLSKEGLLHAPGPTRYRAHWTGDGDVVVSFQMPNSLEHHFALDANDAEKLAAQIRDAAKQEKRQRPQRKN